MTGFDLLGQTYLMCTVFGWGFIVFTLLMGQFGHDSSDGGDGHSIQSDSSGGESGISGHAQGVLDAAHGIHHLDGGSVDGMHVAHGHSGLTGGHHTADGHSGHDADGDGDNGGRDSNLALNQGQGHSQKNLYFTLLSIFSPMSISIFIGFFGVTGIAVRSALPWMGPFTLIPAILAGVVATNIMKAVLAWATRKLSASSLISAQQAIGQIAEVNTPIKEGRLGEVSYVIGLTRFNSAARTAKEGCEISRGSKVIIVETDGSVVLVEPFSDSQLEGH
ncbi:MAG: NfeD family protein [Candidatus Melainabacteria bacterium]|nr:NfeD family protein [Candidatus Melainabacteria bacterium]